MLTSRKVLISLALAAFAAAAELRGGDLRELGVAQPLGSRRLTRRAPPGALEVPAAQQGPAERELVGVLEVGADG